MRVAEVTCGIGRSVMVNLMVAAGDVPTPFVAVMPKVDVPAAVGVPLINPVEVFRVSPSGRVPLAIA